MSLPRSTHDYRVSYSFYSTLFLLLPSGPLQTEAVSLGVVDLIVKLLKTCSDDIVLCGKLMMCAGNMADQGKPKSRPFKNYLLIG